MPAPDPAISWILAASLALLFAAACTHKLADPGRFREVVANYRLVPRPLLMPAAAALVALEIAAVILLLVPAARGAGAMLAASLLLLYAAAMAVNLGRGRTALDCGCFGAGRRQHVRWWMVGRNAALAAAAAIAALPPAARELAAIDALTIAGATLALALLYGAQSVLGSLPRPAAR